MFFLFKMINDAILIFQKNEVLLVKVEARVLDLWLDTSFGPKWPKRGF